MTAQTTNVRTDLQKQAQSLIIQHAIFRWESAVILAAAILLQFFLRRPFPWWPPFGWIILGVAAFIVVVYSSLTDADTNARVLLEMFQRQFNPRALRDPDLRQSMENALEYQRRIETQIRQQRSGLMRDRLEETANQIGEWISNMYRLAQRLDAYRVDDLLARERLELPRDIEQLSAQRRVETNPEVQKQIDSVLAAKANQWQSLRALDARMKQAKLQMDQSLTALATIYSQVQLVDAQSAASGRAERLQTDIQEQVARLNDLIASINEVYNYQSKGVA